MSIRTSRLRRPDEGKLVGSLCLVAVFFVLLPFLLWQNAWREWSNYYWLVQKQAEGIQALGHPTYFLHDSTTGVFYPQFAFYGGTLWGVTGYLAAVSGSAWFAFTTILVLAICSAYGGTYWLARQLGIGARFAHLTALVTVSSPYYVTNIYGRGAWGEVIASSALPLVLASALSVATSSRLRSVPILALLAGTALVAGSHNITLLWGALYVTAVGALSAWALRGRLVSWRRIGPLVLAGLIGVGVNFWFLLPDLAYARNTHAYVDSAGAIDALWSLDRPRVVLAPYPYVPSDIAAVNPASYMQIPLYPMLWALAVGVVLLLRRRGHILRRFWVGLFSLNLALGSLLVVSQAWDVMPTVLKSIQFPLRLHTYVILTTVLLVMVGLLAVQGQGSRAIWQGALVAAICIQVTFALYEAWTADAYIGRGAITKASSPPSWERYQRIMFRSVAGAAHPSPGRRIRVLPAAARVGRVDLSGRFGNGIRRYGTNIIYSDLIRVRGDAKIIGRDEQGFVVLEAKRGDARRKWHARLEGGRPWPVWAGTATSVVCLAVAFVWLPVIAWRRGPRSLGR
jgi:hypothetical protein